MRPLEGNQGHSGTDNTLLTQFNLTYNAYTGGSVNYLGFCIDLVDTVTQGQSYAVNAHGDSATDAK